MLNTMTEANTIMGDLNCCEGSKKRRLEEFIEAKELGGIGTTQHTYPTIFTIYMSAVVSQAEETLRARERSGDRLSWT